MVNVYLYDSLNGKKTSETVHDRYSIVFVFDKKIQSKLNIKGIIITCCPSIDNETIFVCEHLQIEKGKRINSNTLYLGKKINLKQIPKFFADFISNEKRKIEKEIINQ